MGRESPVTLTFGAAPRRWLAALILALAPLAPAQPPGHDSPEQRSLIVQAQAFQALDAGDYPKAEKLLRQSITLDGGNFVFYYNLACVLALENQPEKGADSLIDAVEHGFVDLFQLKRDPQLAVVRKDPRIEQLIKSWPTVLTRHLDSNLKAAANLFDGHTGTYVTTRDEHLRVAFMSAMDPKSTEQARADIARLYEWGVANVFDDLADPDKGTNDAWVAVILPTPKDFVRWLIATYGKDAFMSFAGIGGSYVHDQKRLVAQDLGATLRHEFFHVMHWRSTTRLGQDCPIWIQEGLCSLVEDYEVGADGAAASLKPVPSWRTNMSKRLLGNGSLLTMKQLAAVPRERFTASQPLARYAQARTFFLYLYSTGHLKDWYTAYTTDREFGYHSDPTGLKAVEHVLAKPMTDVEKDFRTWLRALPTVAEQIRPGSASMAVDVEPGNGDGPEIVNIPRDERGQPNPARHAGLRVGDIITAIDGKPTRDLNELVRLLGEHKAGDVVEVSYRRGTNHASTKVTLVDR
jgi:hypothetical protein